MEISLNVSAEAVLSYEQFSFCAVAGSAIGQSAFFFLCKGTRNVNKTAGVQLQERRVKLKLNKFEELVHRTAIACGVEDAALNVRSHLWGRFMFQRNFSHENGSRTFNSLLI